MKLPDWEEEEEDRREGGKPDRTRKVFAFFFSSVLLLPLPPILNMGRDSPSQPTPILLLLLCQLVEGARSPTSSPIALKSPSQGTHPARGGAEQSRAISFRSDCDGQCCKMAFRETPLHIKGRESKICRVHDNIGEHVSSNKIQ